MKNPFKLSLTLLAAACLAGSAALAADASDAANPPPPAGDHHGPRGDRPPTIEMLAKHLSLTPDQVAKIGPLMEARRQQDEALRNDPSLTREQKMEKFRENREAGAKEIEALLTPDQLKKFQEMRERMRAHRRHSGGDGAGAPSPDGDKPAPGGT